MTDQIKINPAHAWNEGMDKPPGAPGKAFKLPRTAPMPALLKACAPCAGSCGKVRPR